MKLIAKRYIDTFAPGQEIPAGRYDDAMLRSLIAKGHVAEVADAPGGPLVIERIPEAESDTVTRVYVDEVDGVDGHGQPRTAAPKAKKTAPKE